jgi:hypothetical protein
MELLTAGHGSPLRGEIIADLSRIRPSHGEGHRRVGAERLGQPSRECTGLHVDDDLVE